MGVAALLTDRWLSGAIPERPIAWQIVLVALDIGVALAVLMAAAWLLRIREFNDSLQMVLRRFRRRT
jgi:hypothetical protein